MSRVFFDTNIPWIGALPISWGIQQVKSAFEFKKSKAQQEKPVILSLARDAVKVRDISNNEGQLAESYIDYNPVEIGDFLLNPMDLYSGANCNVSRVRGVISPAYINLRAKEGINPFYYDYYFKIQYWHMAMFAHGKGVSFDHRWTINRKDMLKYWIPKLSLAEQNNIVAIIGEKAKQIDRLIKIQEQKIGKLKEYRQAVISRAVTKGLDPNVAMKDSGTEWIGKIPAHWKLQKLKYTTSFRNEKNYDSTKKYIALENIESFSGRWVESSGQYDPEQAKVCKSGDVLFGKLRPYLAKSFHVADDSCCSSEFLIMTNPSKTRYLYYLALSFGFVDYVNSSTYGTKMPRASSSFIGTMVCPSISRDEESVISDYLDKKTQKIDRQADVIKDKIEKLSGYKKSLIYEYVTGKKEVA